MAERRQLGSSLPLTLVSLVGTAAATASLARIFPAAGWWVEGVAIAAVSLLAVVLLRALRVPGPLPTIGGALMLVLATTALHYGPVATLGFVPNGPTLAVFGNGMRESIELFEQAVWPLPVPEGFSALLTLAFGAIALVVDLIAVTLRTPAFAGLPLLAVVVAPGPVTGEIADAPVLVSTAAAYLALLWLDRVRRGRTRSIAPALALVGVAAVGALVVPPVVGAASTAIAAPEGRFSPLLDLGADLRDAGSEPVLEYTTDGGPQYLALSYITAFDGGRWAPTDRQYRGELDDFPSTRGLSPSIPREQVTTTIAITGLDSQRLPLPERPERVFGVDDGYRFEPFGPTVSGSVSPGMLYTVESVAPRPIEAVLRNAPTSSTAMRPYLALPDETPAVVGETAQALTAGLDSQYSKAAELERYFTGGRFAYDEEAPTPSGLREDQVGMLTDFLQQRRGYCVHFASAMAVMARELGIPSRIAVGFAPGEATDEAPGNALEGYRERPGVDAGDVQRLQTFEVPANAAHAWPELWFEGVGWIAFEPTPGREGDRDPARLGDGEDPGTQPDDTPPPTEPTAPEDTPETEPTPDRGDGPDDGDDAENGRADQGAGAFGFFGGSLGPGGPAGGIALVALLLLVAGPWVVREVLRNARLASGDPERIWTEVLATARDAGSVPDTEETPRAAEQRVRTMLATGRRPADATAVAPALSALRDAVERMRFARPDDAAAPAPDGVRAVLHAVSRSRPWPRRLRGAVWPMSLVSRRIGPVRRRALRAPRTA